GHFKGAQGRIAQSLPAEGRRLAFALPHPAGWAHGRLPGRALHDPGAAVDRLRDQALTGGRNSPLNAPQGAVDCCAGGVGNSSPTPRDLTGSPPAFPLMRQPIEDRPCLRVPPLESTNSASKST